MLRDWLVSEKNKNVKIGILFASSTVASPIGIVSKLN
jgi:hypothetical protein